MEATGKLTNISTDWQTGRFTLTFEINEKSIASQLDEVKDIEKLSIKAVKYREKRSLDANAYLWILCTKIAEVVKSSKDEVYEEMLQKYGYIYKDDDGYIAITIKADKDISKVDGHWKFYKTNGQFTSYLMIKGSSEYDVSEMARFIDQVVIEAKELGIETMTPAEIERMKAAWGKN